MVSKKYWNKIVFKFGDLLKEVKKKEIVEILGVSFQVLPGVFSPVYSSDTVWFAEQIIPFVKGKKFLEIGSGAGAIACLASINGAARVVATDINPKAVENIRLNAKLHSLKISIREGSLFDPIKKNESFDIIFWNHPFNFVDEKLPKDDMIISSLFDTNYEFLREFFRKGKKHLSNNGKLILGSSNVARLQLIKKMAQQEGLELKLLNKVAVPVYKGKKLKMDLRIYSLTPK